MTYHCRCISPYSSAQDYVHITNRIQYYYIHNFYYLKNLASLLSVSIDYWPMRINNRDIIREKTCTVNGTDKCSGKDGAQICDVTHDKGQV